MMKIRGIFKFGVPDKTGDVITREAIEKLVLRESYPLTLRFSHNVIGTVKITKDMENEQLIIEPAFEKSLYIPHSDLLGKATSIGGVIKKQEKPKNYRRITEFEIYEFTVLPKEVTVDDDNVWEEYE